MKRWRDSYPDHKPSLLVQSVRCEVVTKTWLSTSEGEIRISRLWFRASRIYINNSPTSCNTKQSIYYSAPITRSTQNCNYSLRYWSYFLCCYLPPTWPSLATLEGGSCTVPEAVVTVLCTPDGECG